MQKQSGNNQRQPASRAKRRDQRSAAAAAAAGSGSRFEALESRQMLSATPVYPSVYEQFMVELNNWARANPAAAAERYGVAYNEGPPAYPISGAAKQPLAINPYITAAARAYAQYLYDTNATFSHYADGRSPEQRMIDAGFALTGGAESAQLHIGGSGSDFTAATENDFRGYYTDLSVPGRWHRLNMFNADWKEVGVAVTSGTYQGWPAFITVLDFGFSASSNSFLTGVAYTDNTHDNFYTPGEQMGGVSITAVRKSDGAQFSTTTWASGGYSLALPAGTYTVWGHGGTLGEGWVKYNSVTIGSLNVKRDFRPDYVNSSTGPEAGPGPDPDPDPDPAPDPDPDPTPEPDPDPQPTPWATLDGGTLTILGTDGDDSFEIFFDSVAGKLTVKRDGLTELFDRNSIARISLGAGDGNDRVVLGSGVMGSTLDGGAGNDTIVGGAGSDRIVGGAGNDCLKGQAGNDTVIGNDGNDVLYGSVGNDSLEGRNGRDRACGGDGNDLLKGGDHNDSLYGEGGDDSVFGNADDDLLDGGIGADYLSGGKHIDTVDYSSRLENLFIELSAKYADRFGRSGSSTEQDNVLDDVENVSAGKGNDRIIGSAFANVLKGNAGNDTIYGMGASDTLLGGAGADRFFAADGNKDLIDGGDGVDKVDGDKLELLLATEAKL